MTAEILIASWQKNSREEIRVRLDQFKGNNVICIRAWYPGGDGAIKPGRGGFTVSTKHLPALAEAITKALETARAQGLIQGAKDGDT